MYLNLLLVDYIGASLSNNSLIWDINLTHTLATLYLMGLYGEEEWSEASIDSHKRETNCMWSWSLIISSTK
jgi:hypothetical protein